MARFNTSQFPFLPLAASVLIAGGGAVGGHALVSRWVQAQQQAQIQATGQQLATLIEQHQQSIIAQSRLLAQQPNLQGSDGQVRAMSSANGQVAGNASYADQDVLNRARTRMVPPELHLQGQSATLDVGMPLPGGGAMVIGWPAQPLVDALKRAIPPDVQVQVQQKSGTETLSLLAVHRSSDQPLTPVAVQATNWVLQVGPTGPSPWPWRMALLLLGAGLLPVLPWLLHRFRSSAPAPVPSAAALPKTGPASAPKKPAVSDLPVAPPPESQFLDPDRLAGEHTPPVQLQKIPAAPDSKMPAPATDNSMDFVRADDAIPAPATFPHGLFRAYDVRGPVEQLDVDLVARIGRALGWQMREAGQSDVVLGHDARLTSPAYAEAMAQALADSGLRVHELGHVPTPLVHFAARNHQGNAVMITASHSPGDQNGIKWTMAGHPPTPEMIKQLGIDTEANRHMEGRGQRLPLEVRGAYLDWLQQEFVLEQPFHVSVDGMNGSMGLLAQEALTLLGCEVSGLALEPDGHFPHGDPDPSQPDRLMDLSTDISISGSALGFAFDGDGDRLVVLDRHGQVISPDHLLMLFARMVLELQPGSDIVYDVKSSRRLNRLITESGGRPVMVPTGNTMVRKALLTDTPNGTFGGEFSGHYFFNDGRGLAIDDGLYAALRLLEHLDQRGQTLEEAIAQLPPRFGTPELLLPCPREASSALLERVADHLAPLGSINRLDGVRLDTPAGFVLLRASNTGNHLTARLDADTPEDLEQLKAHLREALDALAPGFSAPLKLL